jgi:alcohol dehydrogenase class IV
MIKFAFPVHRQPARVTFGTGSVRTLASGLIDEHTAVFVTSEPAVREAVDRSLAKRGVELAQARVLTKPAGEPTRASIEAGAAWLAAQGARRIVALGGGSVLDWCRLSWAAADGALDPASGRMADREPAARPPLWLVPTTCATGAEAAGVAVYTANGRKVPVVSPAFVPDDVILDGQFLSGVSDARLGCCFGDAASHAVEAFASIVPGTLAKEAAVSALTLLLRHAAGAPGSSRFERLMEAGYLGGLAAANCSVGVVHAFAHTVAVLGVPHGFANAVAIEAGIRTNADVPALDQLATRVGLATVEDLARAVGRLVAAADDAAAGALSRALEEAGTRADIAARMAEDPCMRTNPKPVPPDDIATMLDAIQDRLHESPSASPHARGGAGLGVR